MSPRTRACCLLLAAAITGPGCNVIRGIQQAATNLSRCTFRLSGISDFSLAGVSLTGKSSLSLMEGASLAASFSRNQLPASFTLTVAAVNPNDGTGGTTRSTATLSGLAWTLLIDDSPTISGDIPSPVTIPGTGQQTLIPIRISLDLVQFFKGRGFDHLVNLALALGGASSSPARLTLRARPTINTDFGPLTYPGEIDIIDKEFR